MFLSFKNEKDTLKGQRNLIDAINMIAKSIKDEHRNKQTRITIRGLMTLQLFSIKQQQKKLPLTTTLITKTITTTIRKYEQMSLRDCEIFQSESLRENY